LKARLQPRRKYLKKNRSLLHSLLKNSLQPRGLKARAEKKGFIAALKALRHPKTSFSPNC
jgi:hypothetical protein